LQTYAFPLASKENLFALCYSEKFNAEDGWSVYEPVAELKRMVLLQYSIMNKINVFLFLGSE
jgi:hypothetical protein